MCTYFLVYVICSWILRISYLLLILSCELMVCLAGYCYCLSKLCILTAELERSNVCRGRNERPVYRVASLYVGANQPPFLVAMPETWKLMMHHTEGTHGIHCVRLKPPLQLFMDEASPGGSTSWAQNVQRVQWEYDISLCRSLCKTDIYPLYTSRLPWPHKERGYDCCHIYIAKAERSSSWMQSCLWCCPPLMPRSLYKFHRNTGTKYQKK